MSRITFKTLFSLNQNNLITQNSCWESLQYTFVFAYEAFLLMEGKFEKSFQDNISFQDKIHFFFVSPDELQ